MFILSHSLNRYLKKMLKYIELIYKTIINPNNKAINVKASLTVRGG